MFNIQCVPINYGILLFRAIGNSPERTKEWRTESFAITTTTTTTGNSNNSNYYNSSDSNAGNSSRSSSEQVTPNVDTMVLVVDI